MKRPPLPILFAFALGAFFVCAPVASYAKGKKPAAGKKQSGKPNAKAKAKKQPAEPSASPTAQLETYIANLDLLLSLDQPVGKKMTLPPTGKVAVYKADYTGRLAEADEAEAAQLQAAISTCDELSAAFAKRDAMIASLERNSAVTSSGTLGTKTKSNFSQGTVGPQKTRTADVKAQAKRERKQNAAAREAAARNDQALTAGALQRWNTESATLKSRVIAAYSKIGKG